MSIYTNHLSCPRHPDAELVEDSTAGDLICPRCGLVVGARLIDVSAEWRTFSSEGGGHHAFDADRSRVGSSNKNQLELHDGTDEDLLTTSVATSGKHHDDGASYYRVKNQSTKTGEQRQTAAAHVALEQMADRLNLPTDGSIVQEAKRLYKKINSGESQGRKLRNLDAIVATCFYLACRREGAPRTIKEITAISPISSRTLGQFIRKVQKAISFEKLPDKPAFSGNRPTVILSPQDYVNRFGTKIGIAYPIISSTYGIFDKIKQKDLCIGRSPVSVAGAVILLAWFLDRLNNGGHNTENKDFYADASCQVARISGISLTTLRNVYRTNLYPALSFITPEKYAHVLTQLPKTF